MKQSSQTPIKGQLVFATCFMLVSCLVYTSTLKMGTKYSSETSRDFQRTIRRYIPKDRNLQNYLLLWCICVSDLAPDFTWFLQVTFGLVKPSSSNWPPSLRNMHKFPKHQHGSTHPQVCNKWQPNSSLTGITFCRVRNPMERPRIEFTGNNSRTSGRILTKFDIG
jgi:hypothetical protein